jgi:hypothetical protein
MDAYACIRHFKESRWTVAVKQRGEHAAATETTGLAVAADSKFWCLPLEFRFPAAERHESRYFRRWDFNDWM